MIEVIKALMFILFNQHMLHTHQFSARVITIITTIPEKKYYVRFDYFPGQLKWPQSVRLKRIFPLIKSVMCIIYNIAKCGCDLRTQKLLD